MDFNEKINVTGRLEVIQINNKTREETVLFDDHNVITGGLGQSIAHMMATRGCTLEPCLPESVRFGPRTSDSSVGTTNSLNEWRDEGPNSPADAEACDTLVHFENVRVDPSEVVFYPESGMRGVSVTVTVDVVAECVMVGCETTCTTSTPTIKDYKTSFGIPQSDLPPDFLNDLKKRGGRGGVGLDELIDEGFVSDSGVDEPGNAYTWFSPVADAIDYGVSHGGGAWADDALGKEAVRPKGKKSISMNDLGAFDYQWDSLTGGVKPCTCKRYVTHSSSSSNSSENSTQGDGDGGGGYQYGGDTSATPAPPPPGGGTVGEPVDPSGPPPPGGGDGEIKTCYCNQVLLFKMNLSWFLDEGVATFNSYFNGIWGGGCEDEPNEPVNDLDITPYGDENKGGYSVKLWRTQNYGECPKGSIDVDHGGHEDTDTCMFIWGSFMGTVSELDSCSTTTNDPDNIVVCVPEGWAGRVKSAVDYSIKCPQGGATPPPHGWCAQHPRDWRREIDNVIKSLLARADLSWESPAEMAAICAKLQG